MGNRSHSTITVSDETKMKLTHVMIERDMDSYNELLTDMVNYEIVKKANLDSYEEAVKLILDQIEK